MVMHILLANLEKFRKWKGWTQDELCQRLDIGRSTLHTWKSGKSKPGLEILEQIAKNTETPLPDLLKEDYVPGENYPAQQYHDANKTRLFQKQFAKTLNQLNTEFAAFIDLDRRR